MRPGRTSPGGPRGGRAAGGAGVVDAPPTNLVDRLAPPAARPWLRLARFDRPIGSWLLMWPCWWSAALAAIAARSHDRLLWHLALFLVGAFVMRGAGSTWNDLLDRDIDAQVERTRNRPLAAGQISPRAALLFAIAQSLLGFLVLVQFDPFTIGLGMASLVPVAIYPLMKRVFAAPQLVLGLCFAYGALVGWSARFGSLDWQPATLYLGSIAWVIGYDTVYGHQDQRDDAVIGVRSTSRTFGRHSRAMVAGLYAAAGIGIAVALAGAGAGWPSWIGLALFCGHLAWQVRRLDPDRPDVCLALFRSNRDAGLILFAGMLLDIALG